MAQIQVLDAETIDKIAAGEVVERPASVVKELVENAIDAKATAITVEIKEGGVSFIRVTDNGCGIEKEQIRKAFLRHATSKITSVEDLTLVSSLGFRGEALSSIAAVSMVELITKTAATLTGNRLLMEGATEIAFEEIGAPNGTTFLVRNLFFNTPVRRKFLKQPSTEAGYVSDLMEQLALSRPDISFQFIVGNQTKFHTSGKGDLREVIYRIYGREIANELIPIQYERDNLKVSGFLGKPQIVRSNRNFEQYYINARYIKSNIIAKAIEEGYKEYLMQHKFPFCVMHIVMDTNEVDVNVHPTKMDVRFANPIAFSDTLTCMISDTLRHKEMIPEVSTTEEKRPIQEKQDIRVSVPQPFEVNRKVTFQAVEEETYYREFEDNKDVVGNTACKRSIDCKENIDCSENIDCNENISCKQSIDCKESVDISIAQQQQLNLFEEKILTVDNRKKFRLIGQVFDTYWLIQYEEKLLIIDQHAAHEKVKYERFIKRFQEKQILSQSLLPPIIVTLTGQEELVLREHMEHFASLGFEIESFGGSEYALRSVPVDLYGCGERELFLAVLDELAENGERRNNQVIEEKIASMSCKAAVKGNQRISEREAEELIDELLTLNNPYHCPHGRPTIVSFDKVALEKMFKRIV